MNIRNDLMITDCHVHILDDRAPDFERIREAMNSSKVGFINILSIASWGEEYIAQNPLCMFIKSLCPEKVYSFGSLVYPPQAYSHGPYDFLEQAERLMEMGFDGMKMVEGKPNVRKKTGIALDSEVYDEYYAFLEAGQIPLLMHVSDPKEFWDVERVPKWALDSGWFYGDGTYPGREMLSEEVNGIVSKFPKLRILFAHFYWLSEDIGRASEFLDRWPNASIDITPGTEMYMDFSKNPEKWRGFFTKYQDRILFGTDNVTGEAFLWADKTGNIRRFLETDDEFMAWDGKIRGLCLERDVLEKIYHKNFQELSGKAPKKLDAGLAAEESLRVKKAVEGSLFRDKIDACLEEIISRLKTRGVN